MGRGMKRPDSRTRLRRMGAEGEGAGARRSSPSAFSVLMLIGPEHPSAQVAINRFCVDGKIANPIVVEIEPRGDCRRFRISAGAIVDDPVSA